VDRYVTQIQSVVEQITLGGQTVIEPEILFNVLHGLPIDWGDFIDPIKSVNGVEY
jgi:hypothetical protein